MEKIPVVKPEDSGVAATLGRADTLNQAEMMAVRAVASSVDSAAGYAADAMGMVSRQGVGRMLQGLRFCLQTADTLARRVLEKNGVNPNVIIAGNEIIVESKGSIVSDAKGSISHKFVFPKDVQHRDDCSKLMHGTECSCDYDERLEDSRLQMALARDGVDVADSEEIEHRSGETGADSESDIEDDDGTIGLPYADRKMREIYGDPLPKNPAQIEMGYDPVKMRFTAEAKGAAPDRVTKHPGDDE